MANTTMIPSDEEKQEVLKLRDTEGMKWGEVAEAMGISSGKAILIYNFATLKPKDKIKDPTPADVQRFRDQEGLSWGILMARTGLSEGALRSMYEEKAGRSAKGTRVGKGGRFPGEETGEEAAPKPAAKKAAAKAPKAPARPSPLKGMKSEEIKEAITGFAIKHGEETIAVKEVKKANATAIVLIDSDGKGRTLKTAAVLAISKKKVL